MKMMSGNQPMASLLLILMLMFPILPAPSPCELAVKPDEQERSR